MNKLNITAITTDVAFNRHASVFNLYKEIIPEYPCALKFISDASISRIFNQVTARYAPKNWKRNVDYCYPIFSLNATTRRYKYSSLQLFNENLTSTFFDSKNLFPERELTASELDVTVKHYIALRHAANKDAPSLIIEDDVVLNKTKNKSLIFKKLSDIASIISNTNKPSYYDLSTYACYHSDFNCPNADLTQMKIALTKTVCSYMVNKHSARVLLNNFFPFALPVDMHIQYLLFKFLIGGGYFNPGLFINGSLEGMFSSSVEKS